jgi:23S rRNA (guanosine2251-2'-O)-methyltransferase
MAGGKRGGQGGRGAKPGSHRKGASVGSGGQRRKGLQGRGPTPPARERTGHPAARKGRPAATGRRSQPQSGSRSQPPSNRRPAKPPRSDQTGREVVVGRSPVVEALRAGVPASTLLVARGLDSDERVREAVKLATRAGVALLDADRPELDRFAPGAVHQGLVLQVPPFTYLHEDDLLDRAFAGGTPLIVALDGVTDPRNLGAVVRSVGAFGGDGVLIPQRRAAGMTASGWKASAGAAARVPVARATNLSRALAGYAGRGLLVAGLAADGAIDLADLDGTDPLVLVVGSEGRGLSRLVRDHCDMVVRIPISARTESLNASVAASVALYEVARRRAASGRG